ncbi:MAG: TRAP transporter substrate-binding protein [Pseudomonadota bacterium]|nr:TRAP transporter substrate-binding protein [Pseudomonadota bacterium]
MTSTFAARLVLSAALAALATLPVRPAAAADIQERSLKMPIVNAITHPQGIGAQKFADLVAEKSGGRIKIKVFPGGTLGGEQQIASMMQGGTIDVSMMAPAQLVGNIPQFIVLDFPFVFASEKEADYVLDGPVGKKLLDLMPERRLVGLAFMEQGYRSISNSKRPITRLEDIAGLKIRTIQNPLYVDMLNTLGANAVPMAFTELYTALETGAVDGQENPFTTLEASKLYEVQKYMSTTRHIYNPQMLLVSSKLWESLSDDEKAIFQEAANEARDFQREAARQMNQKAREAVIAQGVEVNDVAAGEIARMREKVQPVIEKYAPQVGEELLKEFHAELEKARQQP